MRPKLQEAVQPVHAHQLAECAWQRTGGLVMAPLCNNTERKEILFFLSKRDQPQTPEGPAACSRSSTGGMCLAMDPLSGDGAFMQPHPNPRNLFFSRQRDQP
jgi:hypothetical protein